LEFNKVQFLALKKMTSKLTSRDLINIVPHSNRFLNITQSNQNTPQTCRPLQGKKQTFAYIS
jgi:hypothetical protein